MAVFRIHKSKDFTVMSNHHLRNKDLSLKAKGLLTVMLSLPDEWDYSVLGLAALSKDGKDAVMSTLDELKEHGYLSMTMGRDDKGHIAGWTYDVYETPYTENPSSEKPYAENPNTENPPLLNTNIVNNNGLSTNELNEDNFSRTKSTSKNISSPKKEKKEGFDLSFVNINFESAFCMWLQHKHDIKDAYKTQQGIEICYQHLLEMSNNDPNIAQKIVEQAIANNWKGLYPLKQNNNGSSSNETQSIAKQLASNLKATGSLFGRV